MSAQSFEQFVSTVERDLEPVTDAAAVIAFDDHRPGVLMMAIDSSNPAVQDEIQRALAERPRAVALAARAPWSPPDDGPATPSWALVAACPEQSAVFRIRRDCEGCWRTIDAEDAPQYMLGYAARLRAALDGAPL